MGTEIVFNPEALSEIIQIENDGEIGLIAGLVGDFTASIPTFIKAFEAAIQKNDYNEIERQAHSLKSSSRLLGLEKVGAVCAVIEDEARRQIFEAPNFQQLVRESAKGTEALKRFEQGRQDEFAQKRKTA